MQARGNRSMNKSKAHASPYNEHSMTVAQLREKFSTSINEERPETSQGLTRDQASRRLAEQGRNELTPPKQITMLERLFAILFKDAFMVMLEGASALGFIAFALTPDDPSNLYMACALIAIIALTSGLTLFQEGQASDVMSGFQNMMPANTLALRDGARVRISAATLVTGDIVVLGTGDKIPADLRMVSVSSLKVDNSSLTGESLPIRATTVAESPEFLEAHNLVFSGTLAVEGTGIGVVIRTGDRSMVGSIAALASETTNEKSTLELEIIRFIKLIGCVALIMAIVFFGVSLVRFGTSTKAIVNAFVTSFIVVILSNLPQGLPSAVAMSLTIAAKRLAKNNVYVKSLTSVETLGSVSVIASDKTGTLTQNCMTVTSVWMNKRSYKVQKLVSLENDSAQARTNPLDDTLATMALIAGVCNMASPMGQTDQVAVRAESAVRDELVRSASGTRTSSVYMIGRTMPGFHMSRSSLAAPPHVPVKAADLTGNASDVALYVFADRHGTLPVNMSREQFRQVFQVPFSSARKWMLCVLAPPPTDSDKRRILCLKGAPERVFQRCSSIYVNGVEEPITDKVRESFDSANALYMKQGRRVLALSVRRLPLEEYPSNLTAGAEKERFQTLFDSGKLVGEGTSAGLSMVGCTALEDPPKTSVPGAVLQCRRAGIRVVMVTGDHPATAAAIARQCNILGMYNTKEDVARQRSELSGVNVTVSNDDEDVGGVVITGKELQDFSDADWDRVLSKPEIVFARTSPHDKLAIVERLQARGEIVAVTGDGVNDSPALKKADVGVAMGISGSDVAKEAGDIVLIDDEFNSLVLGIQQGRIIFDNLTKLVTFTITHLIAEIAAIMLTLIAGIPQGMSSLCILSVDLLTDVLPALALAYESAEDVVMLRPPRDIKKDRLVSARVMFYAYFQAGIIQIVPCLFAFFYVFHDYGVSLKDLWDSTSFFKLGAATLTTSSGKRMTESDQINALANAQTAFWTTLVLSQFVHVWNCKTRVMSIFSSRFFDNRMLNMASIGMLGIMVAVAYIPFLQPIFGTAGEQSLMMWVPAAWTLVILTTWNEFRKFMFRNCPDSTFTYYFVW